MRSLVSIALGLVLTAGSALHVSARGGVMDALSGITSKLAPSSTHAPASPSVEVAFSPKEGAEQLVIKVIDSADRELRVAAYSFTSKPIVQALVDAKKKRGVDVRVIVDYRNNFVEGCSAGRACAGKHAVNALVNAGIPVRVISKYPIFHHKFVVANGKDVENGSFNYSAAAANVNAENALVNWNNPELAKAYLAKWDRYWSEATDPPQ